jgi:hypothetical protein
MIAAGIWTGDPLLSGAERGGSASWGGRPSGELEFQMINEIFHGALFVNTQVPLRLLLQHLQDFNRLARLFQGHLDGTRGGISLTRHLMERDLGEVAHEIIESNGAGILRRSGFFRSGRRGFRPAQFRRGKIGKPTLSALGEGASVGHLDFVGRRFLLFWHRCLNGSSPIGPGEVSLARLRGAGC